MTGAVAVVELAVATAPPSNEAINIYILGLNDLIFLLNFIFLGGTDRDHEQFFCNYYLLDSSPLGPRAVLLRSLDLDRVGQEGRISQPRCPSGIV